MLLTQETEETEGGWFSGAGEGEVTDRMVRFQHNQNKRIFRNQKDPEDYLIQFFPFTYAGSKAQNKNQSPGLLIIIPISIFSSYLNASDAWFVCMYMVWGIFG